MLKKRFREWLLQVLLEQDPQDFEPIAAGADREPSQAELNLQVRLRTSRRPAGLRRITGAASSSSGSSSSSSRVPTESLGGRLVIVVVVVVVDNACAEPPFTRTGVANMIFRVTADARGEAAYLDAVARTADDGGARLDSSRRCRSRSRARRALRRRVARAFFAVPQDAPRGGCSYANQTDAARTLFRDIEQDNTDLVQGAALSTMNDAAIASPATDSDRMSQRTPISSGCRKASSGTWRTSSA